jgi:hypothetical protein
LADLRTIENLINIREEKYSEQYLDYVNNDYKNITVENEVFETVIIYPKFQDESNIDFYNKEKCDWLFKIVNEVLKLERQEPEFWRLKFTNSDSSGKIVRYVEFEKSGQMKLQRPVDLGEKKYFPFWSIKLVSNSLKSIKKIYSHYNFFSDIAVGLTISNTENLQLGVFDYRLNDRFFCKDKSIKISKAVRYDELSQPSKILEDVFKEICIHFGLVFPQEFINKKIKEILSNT